MNIETRKLAFIQEFLRITNEEIVIGLEKKLQQRMIEQYEESLKPLNMKQFNDEIDQALDDSENDSGTDAFELRRKWN